MAYSGLWSINVVLFHKRWGTYIRVCLSVYDSLRDLIDATVLGDLNLDHIRHDNNKKDRATCSDIFGFSYKNNSFNIKQWLKGDINNKKCPKSQWQTDADTQKRTDIVWCFIKNVA